MNKPRAEQKKQTILLPLRKYELFNMGTHICKFLVLGRLRKDDCPFGGSLM